MIYIPEDTKVLKEAIRFHIDLEKQIPKERKSLAYCLVPYNNLPNIMPPRLILVSQLLQEELYKRERGEESPFIIQEKLEEHKKALLFYQQLEKYPEYRNRIVFSIGCLPTSAIESEISELERRIHSEQFH